jgi:hypothetical protein
MGEWRCVLARPRLGCAPVCAHRSLCTGLVYRGVEAGTQAEWHDREPKETPFISRKKVDAQPWNFGEKEDANQAGDYVRHPDNKTRAWLRETLATG